MRSSIAPMTKVHHAPVMSDTSMARRRKSDSSRLLRQALLHKSHTKNEALLTFGWWRYSLHTLWLFTCNDMKTMVFPSMIFAIVNGLAIHHRDPDKTPDALTLFTRVPLVLCWTWFNLLAFAVNNQKHPWSVKEDLLNKPWRPMPSQRLTSNQAEYLGIVAYPLALLVSLVVRGGSMQSSLLIVLGYLYNDVRGDTNLVSRNILNGMGFTSFASGALEVATQSHLSLEILQWLAIIVAVVSTSVHVQDMYDQVGDAAAGRRTIPLILGDTLARWTIATVLAFWSCLCPFFWQSGAIGYLVPLGLGGVAGLRSLLKTDVSSDRVTFTIYNVWLVSLYALPVLKWL